MFDLKVTQRSRKGASVVAAPCLAAVVPLPITSLILGAIIGHAHLMRGDYVDNVFLLAARATDAL
jgi:hypothetical protein